MEKGKHNYKSNYTFMVIPNDDDKVKTFKLPKWILKATTCTVIFAISLSSYFVFSFTNLKIKYAQNAEDLETLKVVNEKQKEQIDQLGDYTESIQAKVNELAQLENEVKDLVGLPTAEEDDAEEETSSSTQKANEENSNTSRGGLFSRKSDASLNYDQSDVLQQIEEDLKIIDTNLDQGESQLKDLKSDVSSQLNYLAAIPDKWPNNGRITSPFGYRSRPTSGASSYHSGIDIANTYGTSVVAAGKGKVIFAGWKSGYGYAVIISHGYGFSTVYGHNSSLVVKEGEYVEKGQLIAKLGSTGVSTGPHVHFEIQVNGKPVDPMKYLKN